MLNRRIIRAGAAALPIIAWTCGYVSGQVTLQSQSQTQAHDTWYSQTIGPATTSSPWGVWGWTGFVDYGDVIYLRMDSTDRPEVVGTVYTSGSNWLPYWAKPSGPGTWNISDTVAPPSATGHLSMPLRPAGAVVDSAGDFYAVSGGSLAGCFGCSGFRFYSLLPLALLGETYVAAIPALYAVVRANSTGGGAHWLGGTQIFWNGSNCNSAALYYDGSLLHPLGSLNGKTQSFDMAIGSDGVPILVAEFVDVCSEVVGQGLYFARGDVPDPAWTQIAPRDPIGTRGVHVVVDGSGVIHLFGAVSQSGGPDGASGPLYRWWSADNGTTWSAPEVVLPYLQFRDWYSVAVSPAGAIGVAYWAGPYSSVPNELRFAEHRFGSWRYYDKAGTTGLQEPGLVKIAYDSHDQPNIAYWQRPRAGLAPWVKVASLRRPVRPVRR